MQLLIDEYEVSADSVMGTTLENALRQVQSTLCAPGRLVVALRCDGQDIPADEMFSTLQESVSSFDRIEVFTSTRRELVTEAMTQASASLAESEAECDRVADCLTTGKTAAGMEALGQCMGVWQQVHNAVSKSIQMLQLDPVQTKVNDERLIDLFAKPKEVLLQIKEALESQDHVLLADTLKYELSDVTQKWHTVIARIRRAAEELELPADPAS